MRSYVFQIAEGFYLFFKSIWLGAYIVLSHRRFLWLFPGYSIAL